MKTRIFGLLLSPFFIILYANSQTLTSNLYTSFGLVKKKGDTIPFTGKVEGVCYLRDYTGDFGLASDYMGKDEKVFISGNFSMGKENGKWYYFNVKKDTVCICNFMNGILEGELLTYYTNGRLKKQAYYLNGRLNGFFRVWDEKGVLIVKLKYRKGKLIRKYLETTLGEIG